MARCIVLSMTGFGRAQHPVGTRELVVEVRSVNSRSLDVSLRLPPRWETVEADLLHLVRSKVNRGKVTVTVYLAGSGSTPFNRALFRAWARSLRAARPGPAGMGELVQAVCLREPERPIADLVEPCLSAVREALHRLVESRAREGRALEEELRAHLATLRECVDQVTQMLPQAEAQVEAKLRAALSRLGEVGVEAAQDRDRIQREVAFLLARADVREEVARLQTHVEELERVLAGSGPHGRAMEVILQEVQRELNTLSSKACCDAMVTMALKARLAAERMREQAANVE